jgi:hypothetical protein
MNTNTSRRRLALRRTTVIKLVASDLSRVAGGGSRDCFLKVTNDLNLSR